jgi:hypothetical protein
MNIVVVAEVTVVKRLNQSAEGGVLFWFPVLSGIKKNREQY